MFQFVVSNCLTLVIIGVASSTDQYLSSTSTSCITPIEHTAMLSLDIESNYFSIESGFLVNITCSADRMSIYRKLCYPFDIIMRLRINNSREYSISSSLLPVEDHLYLVDIRKTKSISQKYKSKSHLNDVITSGVYNMTAEGQCAMTFEGCFSVFPYINDKNHKKQVFISHDRNRGVAWIFPLWYNRTVKAKFTLSVEHDKDYKAISHTSSHIVSKNGRTITQFLTASDIPIHLVSVALVPEDFIMVYEKRFVPRRTVLWCRSEIWKYISYAVLTLETVTHALDCLNLEEGLKSEKCLKSLEYTQTSNSWNPRSVQYVAVPDYEQKIVITPGLVFLRESDITYDDEASLPKQEQEVQLTAADRAVYHMFVEQFDIDQQIYSWLHDMFIRYFAFTALYQVTYKVFYEAISMNTHVVQTQWDLLYIEALNVNPLRDEISNLSFLFLRNVTAFRTLRMWDLILTDATTPGYILNSVVKQVRKYRAPGSITIDIIWETINTTINHPFDKWFMQEYFVLDVYRNYSTLKAEVRIKNCSLHTVDSQCTKSLLPVKYTFESFLSTTATKWIFSNSDTFIDYIPQTDYIIANIQQTGYYRVNYDLENWKRLGRYLNLSTTLRDPVTCAQILDDAFYFLVRNAQDRANVDLFFELASYLEQETNYALWYPMINALEYLSRYFPLDEDKYITNKVLKILNGFLTRTVYTQHTPFMHTNTFYDNHLRNEVLKWACVLKDVKCLEYIKAFMKLHTEDPTKNKLSAKWQEWWYCQGLQIENVSYENSQIWPLLYRENDSLTTKHLEYLTCSTNEKNIIDSLCLVKRQIPIIMSYSKKSELSHKNITKVKVKTKLDDFFLLLAKHSNDIRVLDLVIKYMQIVKTRVELAVLIVMINSIYSLHSDRTIQHINRIFINGVYSDKINLNTKYKKNFIINAITQKLNDRFFFKWKDDWIKNHET